MRLHHQHLRANNHTFALTLLHVPEKGHVGPAHHAAAARVLHHTPHCMHLPNYVGMKPVLGGGGGGGGGDGGGGGGEGVDGVKGRAVWVPMVQTWGERAQWRMWRVWSCGSSGLSMPVAKAAHCASTPRMGACTHRMASRVNSMRGE
jgi:hypothetical protein